MSQANEAERQSLIQGLHDAVKQCQIRFGGRTELATEKDSRVLCLLIQFERFFQHGIRRNKIREAINSMSEPFRQVTSKVLPNLVDGEANCWPFLREHLSQLEVERYFAIRSINTDGGRARAWLRSCLNEHSLERYLVNFLQNEYIFKQYYEDWSLMQDAEKATTIIMMARGLAPIYFAISVDNPELNGPFRVNQQFTDPSYLKAKPHASAPIVSGNGAAPVEANQKRKKKKAKQAAINDILYPEDETRTRDDSYEHNTTNALPHGEEDCKTEIQEEIRRKTADPSAAGIPHTNTQSEGNTDEKEGCNTEPERSRLDSLSTSFKSTFSTLSYERQHSYSGESKASSQPQDGASYSFQGAPVVVQQFWSKASEIEVKSSPVFSDNPSPDNSVDSEMLSPSVVMPGINKTENQQRSRYSSAMLDEVLGSGEYLSVSDGMISARDLERLRTPPPTPATPNTSLQSSSVDPKQKLRTSLDHDAAAYVRVCLLKEISGDDREQTEDGEQPAVANASASEAGNAWIRDRSLSFDRNAGTRDDVSIASSMAESLCNDLDMMKPLGTDDVMFNDGALSYDRESSKAAVATLAALNASSNAMRTSSPQSRDSSVLSSAAEYPPALGDATDSDSNLSLADLKQAILLTAKRKDEAEERNRVLYSALEEERERCATLQCELAASEDALRRAEASQKEKLSELLRENDVLKNQLKKYVAAVQMLRRESHTSPSSETGEVLSSLRGFSDAAEPVVLPARPIERTSSESDSIYEEKLGQMAELHGELLEFNEGLHKQLINREATLSKLREELINLRGPLPADRSHEIEQDRRESFSLSRPLINIWVPSVFMKGKGSESYHLYQIYIRVGDEEWNIYRRYSQFHKLHVKAVKRYSSLEKFSFPPKKLLGKNDLAFVERRRKRLQDFLRLMINACLSESPQLADNPNKENLSGILPFFCDPYVDDGVGKKKKTQQQPTQKQGTVNPRYTGL